MRAEDIILNETELAVLRALTFKRQSNSEIGDKCGVYSEHLRRVIASLRHHGFRIVSSTKGYWLARTEAEYNTWRRGYVDKIKYRIASVKAMDQGVDISPTEIL